MATTFEERYQAAQAKNYSQGIGKKIFRDIDDFRSTVAESQTTARRWIWELIQNANDVAGDSGIDVEIQLAEKDETQYILFKHNGLPFTAENIQNLIEQNSGKDPKKKPNGRRKHVGKFGTGFLTTHLLSNIVYVKGVNQDDNGLYYKFTLKLDRSGDEEQIAKSVDDAFQSVRHLDKQQPYNEYDPTEMNTQFIFSLTEEHSLDVAAKGIEDLKTNLPYSLCFVDAINSVNLKHEGLTYRKIANESDDITAPVRDVKIVVYKNSIEIEQHFFRIFTSDFTSVLLPIEQHIPGTSIKSISFAVPRIFVDFPLIGTESFPFPAIINNPNFNPTNPRNGISLGSNLGHEKTAENWIYIKDAVNLLKKMVNHAVTEEWGNLHEFAKLGTLKEQVLALTNKDMYDKEVLEPLKELLLKTPIVRNSKGILRAIRDKDGNPITWFPAAESVKSRTMLYEICLHWIPEQLPDKELIEFWHQVKWQGIPKLNFSTIANSIQGYKNLATLSAQLKNYDSIKWLNSIYDLFKMDEDQFASIMEKYAIVPTEAGEFATRGTLSLCGQVESTFLDILERFGKPIRTELAVKGIKLDFNNRVFTQENAIAAILSEFGQKTQTRESARSYQAALDLLRQYIHGNLAEAQRLFPAIVSQRFLLYDDEILNENITKAEKLNNLLVRFNVLTIEALEQKIERLEAGGRSLLPVTEEIIASLGITSVDEWEKAMENIDLKSLFDHKSVASPDMFILANTYINRARQRVIEHLRGLADYDLTDLDTDTADTILAGITKKGIPTQIVFRPAYKGEVIVYYETERDTLDFGDAELWVDDGIEVRQITLGYIIKKNAIKKFPI